MLTLVECHHMERLAKDSCLDECSLQTNASETIHSRMHEFMNVLNHQYFRYFKQMALDEVVNCRIDRSGQFA